jgi:hypothetical protein
LFFHISNIMEMRRMSSNLVMAGITAWRHDLNHGEWRRSEVEHRQSRYLNN